MTSIKAGSQRRARGSASLRHLLGLAATVLMLATMAPAVAAASSGGSLAITTTGLPSGQKPSLVLTGPSLHRLISSQHLSLRRLRPGRYQLAVRPLVVKHAGHGVRSGATALPLKRSVSVTVKAGQTARLVAAYGSVINPGVRPLQSGLLSVVGSAEDPTALVYSAHDSPPAVGTILTSGPTALLPVGLISKVTKISHQHKQLIVSVAPVPVTDAVPELSFVGSLQLKPRPGGTQDTGSTVPAETASVHAHSADGCGISASSQLLQFGAHLDSVELREAFVGAWPPQLKLTLAVRTQETLGLGLISTGFNCSFTLAEIGPFDDAIPVGPLVIPVYATLPLTVKLSLTGSVQAGSINVASTTVAHVAAGFNEKAASLTEQGTHVWSTGPSVSGSATLAGTIGVQAGIGIAKAANLHVEAAFGPEFDASTGHGCNLHLDLGSLSAGAEVLGQSLSTPSFTPFKIPLWSGCKATGGGGTGGGGTGSPGGGTPPPVPPNEEGGTEPPGHQTRIGVGDHHSCTILTSGAVDCWGSNLYGQLGTASLTGPEECPFATGASRCSTTPVAVPGITNASKLATGGGHNCVLLTNGEVECWGENNAGELGTGSTTGPESCLYEAGSFKKAYACSSTPVHVTGLKNASGITAGGEDTCALLTTGGIDCWGVNPVGQLGNGTSGHGAEDATPTPTAVSGIANAVEVVAGNAETCAVLSTGEADCWGRNEYGQLGDNGEEHESAVPVRVSGITNAVSVAVGEDSACALLSSGGVKCWGLDSYGFLGNGGSESEPTENGGGTRISKVPVSVVGLSDAKAITTVYGTVCALRATGSIECWGLDSNGQLGNGSFGYAHDSSVPVPVSGITDATQVAAGYNNVCALLTTGGVDCWGLANYGALGNGTYGTALESEEGYESNAPVAVHGIP